MKMNRSAIVAVLLYCLIPKSVEAAHPWSFAIVVDEKSQQEAAAELSDYASAIENVNGLKVHTIVDHWGVPDSIKKVLLRLYKSEKAPLCGAVFVGDIPVPMIRDAQHLTSAFKMDQTIDRKESSVPSDRFYDDFDLAFEYQGHDVGTPYYYYSLLAEGEQRLQSELFTGRIRPTDTEESSRYEKLRRYLKKATAAKYEKNPLNELFYFTGNGSLNESKVASIDEKLTYYEQFPWLSNRECISYMDYSQDNSVKKRLMNEMMRPDLDFSVLHHHGSPDVQYLNSTPLPKTIDEAKDFLRFRLRENVRRYASVANSDSLFQAIAKKSGVPVEWVSDAFDSAMLKKDSLAEQALNLTLSDFRTYGYAPSSRFVILDACFNASFHLENSIANAYIFSPGNTVAVIGGTVNLLQDKWYNRFAGLLGLGMYAGYFNLFQNYLESHLVGDPTFTFTPAVKLKSVNEAIARVVVGKQRKWSLPSAGMGDVEALNLELRYLSGKISGAELLSHLEHSPHSQVRMEALYLLSLLRGEDFVKGLQLAVYDRAEMVQRFAVNYIRQNGDLRLVKPLMHLYLRNNASQRVAFNVESALMFFPREALLEEFDKQIVQTNVVQGEHFRKVKLSKLLHNANRWEKEVDNLFAPDLKENAFNFIAACMRLYCPHNQVPKVLKYIQETKDDSHKIKLLEAMGWMRLSYNAPMIASLAQKLSQDSESSKTVRREALKTWYRVK